KYTAINNGNGIFSHKNKRKKGCIYLLLINTTFFVYLGLVMSQPLLLSLYVDKLFNCISKSFTSFKRWNFASRNLYFLTSLRITSFSSRTFTYFKVTKADNLYFFTAF